MFDKLSNNTFLTLILICFVAFIVLCVVAVIIVIVIQRGKTKRVKMLTDSVPPSKKDELIGKQLEKELEGISENKNNILDFTKFISNNVKK